MDLHDPFTKFNNIFSVIFRFPHESLDTFELFPSTYDHWLKGLRLPMPSEMNSNYLKFRIIVALNDYKVEFTLFICSSQSISDVSR